MREFELLRVSKAVEIIGFDVMEMSGLTAKEFEQLEFEIGQRVTREEDKCKEQERKQ